MSEATAPAKLILCGEHAVVYGRPAIALPLESIRAHTQIDTAPPGSGIQFNTPDMEMEPQTWSIDEEPDHPLSELVFATLNHVQAPVPDLTITITSDIPIASGMGSGAAVATALIRALSRHLGHTLTADEVSTLVYTSEQRYHGTPSGIDNAVVAYEQAIWFVRNRPAVTEQNTAPTVEPVTIAHPLTLVIGDTGIHCETHLPVGAVRRGWQADPQRYNALFDQVDAVVQQIRAALAAGDTDTVGAMLNLNQALLEQIGVSSAELEHLVAAARAAGALGAKLSGGGWGGIMLALVEETQSAAVADALRHAGAARVLQTRVRERGRKCSSL